MSSENNSSSTKAFGGIFAIIALITGIAAIVQPMNQKIDTNTKAFDTRVAAVEKNNRDLEEKVNKFIQEHSEMKGRIEKTLEINTSDIDKLKDLNYKKGVGA